MVIMGPDHIIITYSPVSNWGGGGLNYEGRHIKKKSKMRGCIYMGGRGQFGEKWGQKGKKMPENYVLKADFRKKLHIMKLDKL